VETFEGNIPLAVNKWEDKLKALWKKEVVRMWTGIVWSGRLVSVP
jgi:hypothetical protein